VFAHLKTANNQSKNKFLPCKQYKSGWNSAASQIQADSAQKCGIPRIKSANSVITQQDNVNLTSGCEKEQ
jgi:hypothetical protein